MTSNRANLDDLNPNSSYIILAIFLTVLSLVGAFFLIRLNRSNSTTPNTPSITIAPTVVKPSPTSLPSSPSATVKPGKVTPTLKPTPTSKPTPTLKPTPTSKLSPTLKPTVSVPTVVPTAAGPTPTFQTLTSNSNKFTVPYQSFRKLYQDKELSGDRYTLYSNKGNIAIHVGTGWSWSNPSRQYTDNRKVAGQDTFIYDINDQRIVDFEYGGLKYTIQCVHGGLQTLKDECNQLLSDFKLL